ncbi:MAG: DUF1569 domain-containing protein [Bacteroidetes bacterium]|nr:DUF1569 domain-containing protein [Verrucomicrobiota bacterium]MDA0873560.1 DUF1569 domain-containing protein [Bacteroidota bacterium]
MIQPDIQHLLERLNQVAEFLPHASLRNEHISRWSIGQQAEHVIRATSAFTVQILRNRKPDGSGVQKPITAQLLAHGMIPRGVADAPEATLPQLSTSPEELETLLLKARKRVSRLVEVHPESVANHPYLGEMDRDEIFRFMVIHLDHHLAIMREIQSAVQS